MRFWDSSAIIPLCVDERASERVRALLRTDQRMSVWWGTLVECWSAFARRRREGMLPLAQEESARAALGSLQEVWDELLPSEEIRRAAGRLLRIHNLRAGDALQLAAALSGLGAAPAGEFVAFDHRLREVARLEGFTPVPDDLGRV